MSLALTEEQQALRDLTRRLLQDTCTPEHVRSVMQESGLSTDVWDGLAAVGLTGLLVPESHGGAGLGHREAAVVAQELGRAVAPVPYVTCCVVGVRLLLELGGDELCAAVLPGVASGETLLAVATDDPSSAAGGPVTVAKPQGDRWSLSGVKTAVPFGTHADRLLVVADTPDGTGVFLVDADADGLTVVGQPSLDQTLPLARLDLDAVDGTAVGTPGAVADGLQRALDAGCIVLASEQVGAGAWCLDTTTEYAKSREQFGVPIGSFQAIQFACADMLIALEESRSAAGYGAWALDHAQDEVAEVAPLTKAWVSDALLQISGSMIQVLGGIGYTWEHDAHLYFKRAAATKVLLGDPDHHRSRLASQVGLVANG